LFGKIFIADHCQIGANAVVNKDFNIPYSIIAGVPAKVLKTSK
jgi:serine O-acetyltransferase